MLHARLVKLGAAICLLLQIWGGAGLDWTCICIRPTPAENSCAAGCCQKKPQPQPDTKFTSHKADGCCISAKLPDDPTLPPTVHESDAPKFIFAFAPPTIDPIAFSLAPAPDPSPPDSFAPRLAKCLASTRLRL